MEALELYEEAVGGVMFDESGDNAVEEYVLRSLYEVLGDVV